MSKVITAIGNVAAGAFLLLIIWFFAKAAIFDPMMTREQAQAFYESAKPSVSLMEALEKHPDLSSLFLHGSECDYQIERQRSGSGYVMADRNAKDHARVSYPTVKDLFRANPQFVKCSQGTVYYRVGMDRGFARIAFETDAQGKIVSVKEPYYED